MASSDSVSVPLIGCVKWFNNSLSYGFVTVITEGKYHNTDVFVHQSNLQTKKECFRTLFTGECIQFVLTNSTNDKHLFFFFLGISKFIFNKLSNKS